MKEIEPRGGASLVSHLPYGTTRDRKRGREPLFSNLPVPFPVPFPFSVPVPAPFSVSEPSDLLMENLSIFDYF